MNKDYADLEVQIQVLKEYMAVMIALEDWHGVSDCANDLREIQASSLVYTSENREMKDDEIAALREQLGVCKWALRELDLTGIQYQETPVDAVGRMRGVAVAALKRLI